MAFSSAVYVNLWIRDNTADELRFVHVSEPAPVVEFILTSVYNWDFTPVSVSQNYSGLAIRVDGFDLIISF